jgi:hypothetical protein
MPRLLAASISMTSSEIPLPMATQDAQVLSGSGVGPRTQLRHLARMRAVVVLPLPRCPQNRYAWTIRPAAMAFWRVRVTRSWPATSSNVWGRHLR